MLQPTTLRASSDAQKTQRHFQGNTPQKSANNIEWNKFSPESPSSQAFYLPQFVRPEFVRPGRAVTSRFPHPQFSAQFAGDSIPLAPQDDSVVSYHGAQVPDPFRSLEDLESSETKNWWQAQNRRSEELLQPFQNLREETFRWHEAIRNYTREGIPVEYGGNSFFWKLSGTESQPTYYVRKGSPTAAPEVWFDPKKHSADGTVALSSMDVSPDGRYIAYTLSDAGSDWQTMHFYDVNLGKDVFEPLDKVRFTDAVWDPDGRGVVYKKPIPVTDLPAPANGSPVNGKKYFASYHHTFGTAQSDDTLLYQRTDIQNSFVDAFRIEEGDPVLFVSVRSGTNSENGVYFRAPGETAFKEILSPEKAALHPFYRDGDSLYAVTDLNASRGRIVKIDLQHPKPENWQTVLPQHSDPEVKMSRAFIAGGQLFVNASKGGADTLERYDMTGKFLGNLDIPVGSTVSIPQVRPTDQQFLLSVDSYLSPSRQFRYDIPSDQLSVFKNSEIPKTLLDIAEVKRLYATSKDGTQVPMWVIQPKNLKQNGTAATMLYGYGGFNFSLKPAFSYNIAHWVEQGGVYVIANLRGGGEFGKDWYDAGRQHHKQNVFDDFAACAEHLIAEGYTQPKRLAISGGSNGGLLTAAVSQQRPDLFGAVISDVPVTDMLRFHTNNFGAAWMSDYGDPEHNPADFAVSMQYSPLHTVRLASDVAYPPTWVTTGEGDDRVAPWHAFKWVAAQQASGHGQTFLRVGTRAGHGAGKPTQKVIEESADKFAFLTRMLGPIAPSS